MLQYVTYCMLNIKTTLRVVLCTCFMYESIRTIILVGLYQGRSLEPSFPSYFLLLVRRTGDNYRTEVFVWEHGAGTTVLAICLTWFIESSWPVENTTLADNNDFTSASFVYPKLSIVNISRLAENIPRKTNFISIWLQLFVWLLPI